MKTKQQRSPFSSHGVLERPRVVAPEAQGRASHAAGSYHHPAPPEMSELWLKAFCAFLERASIPSAWAWEPRSLAVLICLNSCQGNHENDLHVLSTC